MPHHYELYSKGKRYSEPSRGLTGGVSKTSASLAESLLTPHSLLLYTSQRVDENGMSHNRGVNKTLTSLAVNLLPPRSTLDWVQYTPAPQLRYPLPH